MPGRVTWGHGHSPACSRLPSTASTASESSSLENKNNFRLREGKGDPMGGWHRAGGQRCGDAGPAAALSHTQPPAPTAAQPRLRPRSSSGTQRAGPEQWSRPALPRRATRHRARAPNQRPWHGERAPRGSAGWGGRVAAVWGLARGPCVGHKASTAPIALPFPYTLPLPSFGSPSPDPHPRTVRATFQRHRHGDFRGAMILGTQ